MCRFQAFTIDTANDTTDKSTMIRVLADFRPYLNLLMIYHSRKYHNNSERFMHLCQKLGFTLVLIGNVLYLIGTIWYCINQPLELGIIVRPLSFVVGLIQMYLVYISLVPKRERIDTIIKSLQETIEQSMGVVQCAWGYRP